MSKELMDNKFSAFTEDQLAQIELDRQTVAMFDRRFGIHPQRVNPFAESLQSIIDLVRIDERQKIKNALLMIFGVGIIPEDDPRWEIYHKLQLYLDPK